MDGITILKTYEKVVSQTWGWSWFGLIMAILAVIALAISVCNWFVERDNFKLVINIIMGIFIGTISLVGFASGQNITAIHHDAYIHGEVNMDKFIEKYSIVKQDGLIFTIVENNTIEGE